jgi:energy-coupling factor transporter ATP-binding protein EcfA2
MFTLPGISIGASKKSAEMMRTLTNSKPQQPFSCTVQRLDDDDRLAGNPSNEANPSSGIDETMSRTAENDNQPPAAHSDDHEEYLWIDELIRGDFREGKIRKLRTSRCIPNRKLSIFISSTFTDTYRERNCLHEVILPQLQVQFQEYNIQIIFSDMRFGIKDENTLDQMTWILCAQEIERCFEESDGMFFLSLQGNKYGYMPLPKLINKLDFETRLHSLGDPALVERVTQWYSFDDNNLLSHYELKNLESLNDSNYYSNVLPAIRDKAFDELSFDLPELKINRSITEWESLYALHFDPKRVYWMKRELTFDPDRKDLYLFNDVAGDSSRGEKLCSLVDVLSQQLSPLNNIHACQQQISMAEYLDNDEGCQKYLKEWREHVQTRLREVIAEIIGRISRWEANCSGYQDDLKIPGFHMSEILHHCRMASKKASIFLGRESLVENCLALIRAHSPRQQQRQHRPSTIAKTSKGRDLPDESLALDSVCLALVGRSGSGKTALMAKLAFLLYRDSEAQRADQLPVIVRFCGTSRGSIHAIDLIQSITLQLLLVYKAKEEVVSFLQRLSASPAVSYSEAVEAFHAAMSSYPAILLLDSLDQLSNVNEARSRLSFLLNMKIHEKSRVIVSTLPDETSTVRLRMLSTEDQSTSSSLSSLSSGSVGYCYLCETRLKEKNVPTIQVPSYENQPRAAVVALVHGLLTQRNRRVSDSQLETVLTAIQPEPSILYIHLAMEIVSQWKDNQQQVELKSTVIGVIHQIFDSLERQFGSHLTRYSFAFLTYAREGVSDSEMQDLLSLCPAVMAEVFQYSRLETVCRLPIHLWLRIKGAISGLAVERLNNCLSWFHRQLKETSLERFKDLRREVHEILGKYFCSLLEDSVYGKQMILHQPLLFTEVPVWFHASKINNRRVIEGPFHLVQAAVTGEDPENNAQLLVAAVNEICSMEFISALSLHGDLFHQLTVLQTISSRNHPEGVSDTLIVKRLRDYLSWLTKQATTITENPRRKVLSTALQEPAESTVWVDATRVIDRESFPQRKSDWARGDLWARERPFFFRTEAGLLSRLVGHTGAVVCVQWSPSGDRIASASSDQLLKLWDPLTGQVLVTCEGHQEAIKAIDWHPSGLFFASGGAERQAFLWDIVTGAKVSSLPMEKIAANTTETSGKSYQWITPSPGTRCRNQSSLVVSAMDRSRSGMSSPRSCSAALRIASSLRAG